MQNIFVFIFIFLSNFSFSLDKSSQNIINDNYLTLDLKVLNPLSSPCDRANKTKNINLN